MDYSEITWGNNNQWVGVEESQENVQIPQNSSVDGNLGGNLGGKQQEELQPTVCIHCSRNNLNNRNNLLNTFLILLVIWLLLKK